MKSIRSLEANNKARLLYAVIGYRRETEKIEKDLKEWIKGIMGEDMRIIIGDFLVTRKEAERRDLDKEALKERLGPEYVNYEKLTVYEVLNLETFHKNKGAL